MYWITHPHLGRVVCVYPFYPHNPQSKTQPAPLLGTIEILTEKGRVCGCTCVYDTTRTHEHTEVSSVEVMDLSEASQKLYPSNFFQTLRWVQIKIKLNYIAFHLKRRTCLDNIFPFNTEDEIGTK